IVIGVFQRGESAGDALAAYALFTVGDGLVTQIPAFMISTATGLVVTKASSDSNLGTDISNQLLSNPKVLGVAAAMLAFLGLIPGLPKASFFFLAAVFGTIAYVVQQTEEEVSRKQVESKKAEETAAATGPEDVSSLLSVDPLELEIGYNLIPLVDTNQGGDLLNRITLIRRQIAIDLGLVVPPIRIRDNIQLHPSSYVFKIKGSEFAQYEILPDHFLAMVTENVTSKISGIEVEEPAFGLPAIWIQSSLRDRAEMAGYTVVDPSTVIATHLTEVIRKNAQEILGRQELQQLLDNVNQTYPLILKEVVPDVVNHSALLKILQNLLKEGVSIRHMVNILESMADCKNIHDVDSLTEIARQGLARHICKPLIDANGSLKVLSLNPQLEQMLSNALQKIDGSVNLAIDPTSAQKLLERIRAKIEDVMNLGYSPIILCSSALRLSIKRLTERIAPRLTVLSYQEIPTTVKLESVGLISLQGN
ncbi:MAG TPA: flagellar biosynthesis protein FlhA, partial [Candidatus Rifleibacterium sp.]|nr:flagellar biosynthesis protein FlhA [Candidatus Rifleibacterium sp.]